MGDKQELLGKSIEELKEIARRDDALDFFVPSDIRGLLAEIERLRASGWRDIESAPKDGTRIDVLLDNNARYPNVHWGSWDGVTPEYECWLDEFNNPVESHLAAKVAHWMPLPPPPQESE